MTATFPSTEAKINARALRVAMIGNHWSEQSGGGMERYFSGLARYLAQRGDAVDFFTLGEPPADYYGAHGARMAPQEAGTLKRAIASAKTFSAAFANPYDVVNFHFALTGLPALPFIPKNTQVVATFHGPWALESTAEGQSSLAAQLKMQVERLVLRRATRFITVSDAFGDLLAQTHRIERSRISTVPLGIDTDFFVPVDRREARECLGWPQDRRIIFTARRLIARVGLTEFIDAVALLKDRGDIFCAVAGRGPLQAELQARIDAKALSSTIKLLGFVSEDDLALAYAAADLVILPSQRLEGFGSVIAEAFACGTPVMVTPVGGMPEFIRPMSEQLVMSGIHPEAIADSLRAYVAGELALPNRERCRTYALETFAWPLIAQRVHEIFAQT